MTTYYNRETGEALTEEQLYDMFDNALDDETPSITIGPWSFPQASYVLKKVDPEAYRESFLAWLDSEIGYQIGLKRLDGKVH